MKRRKFLRALLLIALSVLTCGLLFACGSDPAAPEVTEVSLVSSHQGALGASHKLNYTATEGAKISTSVELNGNPATAEDFLAEGNDYRFYSEGEFTVTVYAQKDGMTGNKSVSITVSKKAFVDGVDVTADESVFGKVSAVHTVHYVAAAGSSVTLSAKKDGAPTEDALFDGNSVTFRTAGKYTVTVTSAFGEDVAEASKEIDIVSVAAPTVQIALDKTTVEEDGTATITKTVTPAQGDHRAEERVAVLYKSGADFAEADKELYTLNGDRFTPHIAGSWKLVLTATTALGGQGTANTELSCTPLEVSLQRKNTVRNRIETGKPFEVDYGVEGAAEKYDVTFDVHGHNATAEKGEGMSVCILSNEPDWFTVTVIYTHKVEKTLKKTVDVDVYSVENLAYAPVWGEDPFDGMPDEALTNMGYLLYLDATDCAGRKISPTNAVFDVIDMNIVATSGAKNAGVRLAAGSEQYPYLFVDNLEDGVATGDFTVKVTLTDPATGYSVVAEKTFGIVPTQNSDSTSPAVIEAHIEKYSDFFDLSKFDFSGILGHDIRLNMILTKTGVIVNRADASWDLHVGNAIALVDMGTSETCTLEFTFTPVVLSSGQAKMGVGLRTGNHGGWVNYLDLAVANGNLTMTCTYSGSVTGTPVPVQVGKPVTIRIARTTTDTQAVYVVSVKTDGDYVENLRVTASKSSSAGNAGAPVVEYQFDHRGSGCYAIENVTVS